MQTISASQASAEVPINENFTSVAPAEAFSKNPTTTTGLTFGYNGGSLIIDGINTAISAGTVTLAASNTSYVQMTRAGVISSALTEIAGSSLLYSVVTGATTITTITDLRTFINQQSQLNINLTLSVTTADVTMTRWQASCDYANIIGALTGNRNVIVPNYWRGFVINSCSGPFDLAIKTASGLSTIIPQGGRMWLIAEGTNCFAAGRAEASAPTSVAVTAADVTLNAGQAFCRQLTTTGVLTANRNVILPNHWEGIVYCNNTGAFTTTFKTSGGTGIVVAQTKRAMLLCDGTNTVRITADV